LRPPRFNAVIQTENNCEENDECERVN
jgi:hypothetical protein